MDKRRQPEADCDSCGNEMRLVYVLPKLGPHAEIHSFKCDDCGWIHTRVIEDDGEDEP